jgi:hypothetical protein
MSAPNPCPDCGGNLDASEVQVCPHCGFYLSDPGLASVRVRENVILAVLIVIAMTMGVGYMVRRSAAIEEFKQMRSPKTGKMIPLPLPTIIAISLPGYVPCLLAVAPLMVLLIRQMTGRRPITFLNYMAGVFALGLLCILYLSLYLPYIHVLQNGLTKK